MPSDKVLCALSRHRVLCHKEKCFGLLQSDKDSLIFVNHTDGNVFYKETGRLEIKRQFYRIPCVYDWNNGSKLLDRVFLEALSAVISKPCRKQVKGGAGAGRKYIISKNK
jgi:hypothetical protein